jgi:hypothetical protein
MNVAVVLYDRARGSIKEAIKPHLDTDTIPGRILL